MYGFYKLNDFLKDGLLKYLNKTVNLNKNGQHYMIWLIIMKMLCFYLKIAKFIKSLI